MAAESGRARTTGTATGTKQEATELLPGQGSRETPAKKPSPEMCPACDVELVTITMTVDGNDLVMESCQTCDERRWHLAGEKIDLQQALAEVGEHAGRRR